MVVAGRLVFVMYDAIQKDGREIPRSKMTRDQGSAARMVILGCRQAKSKGGMSTDWTAPCNFTRGYARRQHAITYGLCQLSFYPSNYYLDSFDSTNSYLRR